MNDAPFRYDAYWAERCAGRAERTRRRSVQRARIGLDLLSHRGGALLDVGCGPGYAAAAFAAHGFEVTGVDVSQAAVDAAAGRGVRAVRMDVARDPLPAGSYDVIAALEVLEHVPDPVDLLTRMRERLAPGGEMLVSLPNEFHLVNRLRILAGREPLGGHDDPHVRHFGLDSARRLLRAGGADIRVMRAASIVPPGLAGLDATGAWCARLLPRVFGICFVCVLAHAAADPGGREARP